ncbi:hypothetical protein C6502_21930 [Candidatus Poribacteria bacterium]|nr:MAG: hypothetical protein C6502_21930 [Candidatus Poribacteria bacterium]
MHYLHSVEELWTLLIGKVAQRRFESVIIECFLFFVKQIQWGFAPSGVKANTNADAVDKNRRI